MVAMHVGARGMMVWMGTSSVDAVVASVIQSHNIALTKGVRCTHVSGVATRACCKIENKLLAPYSAEVLPRRCLQWCLEVSCWVSIFFKATVKDSKQYAGRDRVMECMLMSQPRTCFSVEKDASALVSLESDITGRHGVSGWSWKTLLIACNRVFSVAKVVWALCHYHEIIDINIHVG